MSANTYDQAIGFIKLLELNTFYPKKITRQKALTVSDNDISHADLKHIRQIPWFMLENLLTGNYEGRSFELGRQTTCDTSLSYFLEDSGTSTVTETVKIHPLDVLTALFMCCDDFLRQLLVEKLFMCQLSIPLILPDVDDVTQTPEMLLWATSTLSKQWKTSSGSPRERSITTHPFPILSVLRVGRPRLSKSSILNNIINANHETFFHSGCKGGSAKKNISNGMLEMMWYLPMGNNRDYFHSAFGIMNLRGNAYDHKKQLKFMTKTSSNAIIFCSFDMCDANEMNIITSWNKENSHLIIVFDKNPVKKWIPILRSVEMAYSKEKMVHIIIIDNMEDVLLTLRKVIKDCIDRSATTTHRSLEDCEVIATNAGIQIDVKVAEENSKMKIEATEILSFLNACPEKTKDIHLPLQLLAADISTKERELLNMKMRGEQQTEMYAENIKSEIKDLRKKQKIAWENRSELITRYIKSFNFPHLTREYLNQWMSIMLNRYSIHHLQRVRQDYKTAWQSFCGRKRTESLTEKLDIFQEQLFNFSIGIENVNREIAQVYEMALGVRDSGIDVKGFPDVAAEMLLDGHPLELIDGDATFVPVTWLKAVLTCLKSKVGNTQIFVLSVLGVQGSGKSTMLNTMFGLKFPVSVGRCTRGAFAQLVPLDQTLQHTSSCKYILVIDTEGLRAPDLTAMDQNNRDNEIATFVIGLGDATLINILGENQTDMQDILQIVVHALMKMKCVNLKPSCILVHQGVSDISALEKCTTQKIKLRELLDKTTKMSAEVQRSTNTCISFTDVINFQEDKHVAYISNLWQGDPPMAPPNPGYTRCIRELRKMIINVMEEVNGQTIDEFITKLTDLRKAVLCEHFVFSFKNTLEIQAYSALEIKYIQVSRDFRQSCITNCNALVNACSKISAEKMDLDGAKILEDHLSKLGKSYTSMFDKMTEYFNKNTRAVQWKAQIKDKMSTLHSEVRNTLKDEFRIVEQSVIWKAKIDKDMMKYVLEIRLKSGQLAEKFRDLRENEVDLRNKFNDSWKEWIQDIPVLTNCIDIKITLERILIERFTKDKHVIQRLLQDPMSVDKIKVTRDDIHKTKSSFLSHFRQTPTDSNLKEAGYLKQLFLNEAISFIDHHKKKRNNCNEHILKETVDLVSKQLTNLPDTDSFVFTDKGIARNTFCILWTLLPKFEALQRIYRKLNDPRDYMDSQRERLWHMFKNECTMAETTLTAVGKVVFALEIATTEAVKQYYAAAAINHFTTTPYHIRTLVNKKTFHVKMLIDIAETKSFELFTEYLVNPSFRMSRWLQEYISDALEKESDIEGITVVKKLYNNSVHIVYQEARRALISACKDIGPTCKLDEIWQSIIDHFRMIPITSIMSHISDDNCDIKVNVFLEKLLTELDVAEKKLYEKYNDELENILKIMVAPAVAFFEEDLIGCKKMCPFCEAVCDNSTGCQSHRTECHRPQGIRGLKCDKTNKLVVDLCTTAVCSSQMSFHNSDVDEKWHSFNMYRVESWNIEPIKDSESQLYWKWFMATYNKQLAEFYGCEEADVPDSWKDITWESAKMDMVLLYNL